MNRQHDYFYWIFINWPRAKVVPTFQWERRIQKGLSVVFQNNGLVIMKLDFPSSRCISLFRNDRIMQLTVASHIHWQQKVNLIWTNVIHLVYELPGYLLSSPKHSKMSEKLWQIWRPSSPTGSLLISTFQMLRVHSWFFVKDIHVFICICVHARARLYAAYICIHVHLNI